MRWRRTVQTLPAAIALLLALSSASAVADDLQDAMDRADALNFFRQIGLERAQAQQMIAPLERIQDLVKRYRERDERRLQELEPTLRAARQALIEGRTLDERIAWALESYQAERAEARSALRRAVAAEMQVIARTLYPEQNAMLDWTPPAAVRPEESIEERLEVQRIAMGRIEEAVRVLERIKYLDAFHYVTGRIPIINDYLARYYEPNSPEFQEAGEILLEYTGEVRMLEEDEWRAHALDIAADMIDEIGLMPRYDPEPPPGTVSWNALYRLVTNPQTLQVVRSVAGR